MAPAKKRILLWVLFCGLLLAYRAKSTDERSPCVELIHQGLACRWNLYVTAQTSWLLEESLLHLLSSVVRLVHGALGIAELALLGLIALA